MSISNIIAQVLGFVALACISMSYQTTDKKKYLFINIFSNIFYALQYLFLGAMSGFVNNIITLFKTGSFYGYEKKGKYIPLYILLIYEILAIISGTFTYEGLYSLIPIIVSLIYNFAQWQKSMKVLYIIGIISAILYLIYDIFVGAYVAVIASVIEAIACAIGFVKLIKKNRIENK